MLELEIEKNIVAAIRALGLNGLVVRGAWNPADVKIEDEGCNAVLDVHVPPRSFDAFGHPAITFSVALDFAIRADIWPDGSALEAFVSPVADLVQSWNLTLFAGGPDCGLGVDGMFEPAGVQLTGGDSPTLDRERSVWSVGIDFTLRGTALARDAYNNQQEES